MTTFGNIIRRSQIVGDHFQTAMDLPLDKPERQQILTAVLKPGMTNSININTMINLKLPCLMPSELDISQLPNFDGCSSSTDSNGICWPSTSSNQVAYVPCSPYPWGRFDKNQMETTLVLDERICLPNGVWSNNTDTSLCSVDDVIHSILPDLGYIEHLWTAGYALSLASLIIGMKIFMQSKTLHTRKNIIQVNLFSSYMLISMQWLYSYGLAVIFGLKQCAKAGIACKILIILELYFNLTTFIWMMLEALYSILKANFGDSISLKTFALIGWGFPAIITAYLIAVKSFITVADSGIVIIAVQFSHHWYDFTISDRILHRSRRDTFHVFLSVLFLIKIIGILIDELRSPKWAPCKTAAKIILMIISLISNLVLLSVSNEEKSKGFIGIWNAIYISTLGCCMAVLHCFLNGKVEESFRTRNQNDPHDTYTETDF